MRNQYIKEIYFIEITCPLDFKYVLNKEFMSRVGSPPKTREGFVPDAFLLS